MNFEIRLDPNCTELDEHTLNLREHLFKIKEERESNLNRTDVTDGQQSVGSAGRRMAELDVAAEAEVIAYVEHQDYTGIQGGNDAPLITLGDHLANLVVVSPMKDLWNGRYIGQFDFSDTNEDYEGTANDRENLGDVAVVSPEWSFTRPGRYRFRVFGNNQLVHIHGESH